MSDTSIIGGIFAVILLVAVVLLAVINRGAGKKTLDAEWYAGEWRAIEDQFRDGHAGQALAVMNADKLLDKAMQDRRFRGKTVGERLKAHPNAFTDVNSIWKAHKLRNRIAHEHVQVSESDCKSAIYSLRQGLKDLGALR